MHKNAKQKIAVSAELCHRDLNENLMHRKEVEKKSIYISMYIEKVVRLKGPLRLAGLNKNGSRLQFIKVYGKN